MSISTFMSCVYRCLLAFHVSSLRSTACACHVAKDNVSRQGVEWKQQNMRINDVFNQNVNPKHIFHLGKTSIACFASTKVCHSLVRLFLGCRHWAKLIAVLYNNAILLSDPMGTVLTLSFLFPSFSFLFPFSFSSSFSFDDVREIVVLVMEVDKVANEVTDMEIDK